MASLPELELAYKHWCTRKTEFGGCAMIQDDARGKNNEKRDHFKLDPESLRHPYDANELDKVPRPTDDDPPYRSWWVM
jgi:hypothetical protein